VLTHVYDISGANGVCTQNSYGVGRLARETDALGSVSYCYDARGNLLEKIRSSQLEPTASLAPNELRYRVAYRYTLANQLAAVIYPDGDELRYTRNSAGQITQVVYASKQSNGSFLTETVLQSAQYAPFGPLTQLNFGNGSQWTRALDQNYAIDAISSAALNLDATLDDVGNFTGLNSSGQSYQFGYDPLYRLTDLIQGSSVLEHFDYDATGNRTAATLGGAAQSYAYPTNSHRLQSINGISRDYDNVGNTTQRDGLTHTYNGRNRLSRVSMGRTTYYSNTYNARGEREEKSLTNGMSVQRFIYDEAGRLIQTGNVPQNKSMTRTLVAEQRLLWLDDQLVGVKMMKVESNAYAGELLYAHTDHLGTPRALSRASNNSTVWRWPLETTAFGQHPAQSDPDGDGQVLTFNLRYPGQYFDSESGLHYNYFRDYEPATGRYVESDPIGLDGGIGTYVYVDGNPVNWSDPFGWAKGGNQNQLDSGLADLSDEEVSRRARDRNLSGEERRRYQKEEKGRGGTEQEQEAKYSRKAKGFTWLIPIEIACGLGAATCSAM